MADQWPNSVFSGIFGQECALCGAAGATPASAPLCADCLDDLPYITTCCSACAVPLAQAGICGACQRRPFPFQSTTALLRWQPPADWLIHQFKYNARLELAGLLGRLLTARIQLRTDALPDLLIPAPLYPLRLRKRGFNQALELARVLGTALNIELSTNHLLRVRSTVSQTGLSPHQRRRNLRGAFATPKSLNGRHIALLDDVLTTGSTASEMTRTLLRGGASKVEVWTVARSTRR